MIKAHTSKNGQHYFTLCGKNGAVILTSEMYKSKRNMHKGVAAALRAFHLWIEVNPVKK